MCPSYMATREEKHSTRGRANVLRLAMAGRLGEAGLGDDGVYETLDLCLECRACKAECPVGVDVARFKSEFLADYWQRHGTPLQARALGNARTMAALGSRFAPLSNWMLGSAPARALNEPCSASTAGGDCRGSRARPLTRLTGAPAGGDDARALRRHLHELLRPGDRRGRARRARAAGVGRVAGRATAAAAGRRSPRDCSPTRASWRGATPSAVRDAAAGRPIVFCEPSCLSAVREDAPALLQRRGAGTRAAPWRECSVLFEEYLASSAHGLPLRAGPDARAAARPLPSEVDGAASRRRRRCCRRSPARPSSIPTPAAAAWPDRSATPATTTTCRAPSANGSCSPPCAAASRGRRRRRRRHLAAAIRFTTSPARPPCTRRCCCARCSPISHP